MVEQLEHYLGIISDVVRKVDSGETVCNETRHMYYEALHYLDMRMEGASSGEQRDFFVKRSLYSEGQLGEVEEEIFGGERLDASRAGIF